MPAPKFKLRCIKCNSTDIKVFKVRFNNDTWHARGVCRSCGRYRNLNKEMFFSDELPEIDIKRTIRKKLGLTRKQTKEKLRQLAVEAK